MVVLRSTGRRRVPLLGVHAGSRPIAARRRPRAAHDVHHVQSSTTTRDCGTTDGPRFRAGARETCSSSYEAQGNDVSVVIQRWVTELTDPASGCATTGPTRQLHGLRAECRRSGRGQPDGYSYVPAGRVRQHDPRRTLRRDGAELSARSSGKSSTTPASPSARSGCTRAHPRPSPRTCRTTSRRAPLTVRSCSASGTKFHDLNANGRRDAGEAGIAPLGDLGRLRRRRRASTPTSRSRSPTAKGQYVINDIRPPDGTYTLRETLLTKKARQRARAAPVICTLPATTARKQVPVSAPGGQFQCGWPVVVAAHDLRSEPRLRQLPGG